MGEFSIHWVALLTLFCVSVYFFCTSVFLPNISNPHAPTLEHTNLSRLDPDIKRKKRGILQTISHKVLIARIYKEVQNCNTKGTLTPINKRGNKLNKGSQNKYTRKAFNVLSNVGNVK